MTADCKASATAATRDMSGVASKMHTTRRDRGEPGIQACFLRSVATAFKDSNVFVGVSWITYINVGSRRRSEVPAVGRAATKMFYRNFDPTRM